MKVILLQDIKKIGKKDEIINANDGYARNYLIPKKLAVEANPTNLAKLKSRQDSKQYKKDIEKHEAEKIEKQLQNIFVEIPVKAGANGKVFGGVTAKDICEKLKEQNKIEIDKKKLNMPENLKSLGLFTVEAKLYEGVVGKIKVRLIEG